LIPIPSLSGRLALFPRLPHPSPTPTAPFRVIGTSTAAESCDPLMPAGRKEGRKEVDVVMQNDMKFVGLKFLPFSIALCVKLMRNYVCMSSNFFLFLSSF
ncbi:unnamed protein product, partial [Musa textilis]